MDEFKTDDKLVTEEAEAVQETEIAQEAEDADAIVEADVGVDCSPQEEGTADEAEKSKKGGLKAAVIVLVVAVVVLVALVGIYVVAAIQSNKLVKEAIELIDQEEYEAATAKLDELSGNAYRNALKKLQVVVDERLDEYIEDEEYVDAYALIHAAQWHPDYEDIREMITAESWIWTCVNNLKPVMKNPRSLQINSVEIYVPYDDGADYPVVVLCESGQNGFGGYATSYTVYDDDDLSLYGSTSSISDPDDLNEAMVALLIKGYRNTTEIKYEYDLNRINKLLSDGVTVKPDLQKYKLGSSKNT